MDQMITWSIFFIQKPLIVGMIPAGATAAAPAGFAGIRGRTVNYESGPVLRIIDEFYVRAAQVVKGHIVYNDVDSLSVKDLIVITDDVVERHTKLYTTATTTRDIDPQVVAFQLFLSENLTYGLCSIVGDV
jgi:hypothetical protein